MVHKTRGDGTDLYVIIGIGELENENAKLRRAKKAQQGQMMYSAMILSL